jgi:hypothetical protein
MNALAGAHDAAVRMIDTSIVRVHQHAACIARNSRRSMGRPRGGLTSKIHAVVDSNGLPVRLALTAGEAAQPASGGSYSFHLMVRPGIYPEDWAGDSRADGSGFGER